jgi:ribosomal protein S18 acetylase RimI-like enzyme
MRDEILPAHEFPMNRLADVFSRAYTGYIAGNFTMDVPTFARFLSQHGVDLWLSRIFVRNGQPVGFGCINRTGDFSRLASLGVVPEARRQGVGRRLTQLLLEESRERGERAMMLEVIEQNQAAHQLYLQLGFQKVDRLLGWRLNPYPALPHAASLVPDGFREITPLEAVHFPNALEYPELPWQVSRHAIAKAPPGARAYASNDACIVFSPPETAPVRLLGLFTPLTGDPAREALLPLLAVVRSRFADRTWWIPAVLPESLGRAVLAITGFMPEPLSQFLMRRSAAPQTNG